VVWFSLLLVLIPFLSLLTSTSPTTPAALAGENAVLSFTEDPRFFQVSDNASDSDIGIESIAEGKVAWSESDWQNGGSTLKFFDGSQTKVIYEYSSSEVDQLSGTWPWAIIFGDCVLYRLPDFKGDWYEWRVYDPTFPEPEEPFVSDGLHAIAEGNIAVWVRSLYESESDTQPYSIELRKYTCGSGTTTLAAATPDGSRSPTDLPPIDPEVRAMLAGFYLQDGLIVWTYHPPSPTGWWYEGDVTTEIWVHDATGSRKTWECTYPVECTLPPDTGYWYSNLIDWQQVVAQRAVDGGVIALRTFDWETLANGLLIHQVGSGAGSIFFPGSGSYYDISVRDGYVAWIHWGKLSASLRIFLQTMSPPEA
jgi:hypothetical protein